MEFLRRRDFRGAFRATPQEILPEDILRDAIARHKALRDREELRAKGATPTPARIAAPRNTAEETRRAKFAEAIARATFGRFYPKERPK